MSSVCLGCSRIGPELVGNTRSLRCEIVIGGRDVLECAPEGQVVRFGFDVRGVASVSVGPDRVEGARELGLQYATTPPLLSPQILDGVDFG
jgi:hypothetical protein